ncbi:putative repeat protein (TIGR01451 family) [Tahibacter aquaticus]|uniref:Putative repeat protein (TIGR01451 family) n=1 Tax=Tahibacter aquaticus TaxID=520092 RepID=A0A4R6YNL3_9GAMM|nr:putative repeat protein (TIGR01451 family) [Tahibacter aquaticus]
MTNTATVSGGGDPSCPAATRCSDTEGPTTIDAPQLTLTKTASSGTWGIGIAASYALQVTNTGTAATTLAATITDLIPAGLTIGTLPAGCSATGQTVTCTVAAGLAAGSSTIFVIPVTPTAAAGTSFTNTATISGGGDATCPGDVRCTGTAVITLGAPSVTVSKTSNPASGTTVTGGDGINYQVQVQIAGAPLSQALTFSDALDAQLTLVSVNAGVFSCVPANPLVCSLPAGTAAGTYTVDYVAQVAAMATGAVGNVVTVTSNGGDPDPVCATCSTTHPLGSADTEIIKTVDNASPLVGSTVNFTIMVRNNGPDTATGVVVTDALPSGFSFLGASGTQGSYAAPLWSVGTLASGATATLYIQARVNATGSYTNVASVDADQNDPIGTNNVDDVMLTPRAVPNAVPVPAAGPWMLTWLGLLIALVAGLTLYRRRVAD